MKAISVNLPKPKKTFYLTDGFIKIIPTNFIFQHGEKFEANPKANSNPNQPTGKEDIITPFDYSNLFSSPKFIKIRCGDTIFKDDIVFRSAKTGNDYVYVFNKSFRTILVELIIDNSYVIVCSTCGKCVNKKQLTN